MENKWEYHTSFNFAGKFYITWIKHVKFDDNMVAIFEHKTKETTKDEIKEAMKTSNYFININDNGII